MLRTFVLSLPASADARLFPIRNRWGSAAQVGGWRKSGRGLGGGCGIKTHLTFLAGKRQMLRLDERAACNTQKFLAGGYRGAGRGPLITVA